MAEQSAVTNQVSQEATRLAGLTSRINKAMAEQTHATFEITKSVDDTRKQLEQSSRAMGEQARTVRGITVAGENISKQIGSITRANRQHSKVAGSVLESLHTIRTVTAQNSEGARSTLRGTRNLLDTIEALVADMDHLGANGNLKASGRKRPSQKQR